MSISIQANKYITSGRLSIDEQLHSFINKQVLPKIDMTPENFWLGFESIASELTPTNEALLAKRDSLQQQIDEFHKQNQGTDFETYKAYLQEIDYLISEPADFKITSSKVDEEIATMAGPQLVVPVMNARYALNAANARWGSLYDALYGTDIILESEGAEKGGAYNPVRGEKVVAYGRDFLQNNFPLAQGHFKDISGFVIQDEQLMLKLDGELVALQQPEQFIGYQGTDSSPTALLLKHNNLHAIIEIDASDTIGMTDKAHIKDITLEAALTTIMDCEDSVAAVDAEDKVIVYQNWLGLMQGDLSETVSKGGQSFTRELNKDRVFTSSLGKDISLAGRSLLFVRNVGHLMTNPAILLDGKEVQEGIMDGIITSAIGKIDIQKNADAEITNSRTGSIYIVKPKMHGPEEVALANTLFDRVEDLLNLERNTIKMGIMDEERRTSINLKACVEKAKQRVVFINTGFLDRTGDEIHTSMAAGIFAPKAELKTMPWIQAYENSNVAVGLQTGFLGKAQIGKGMWPIPDQMQSMMDAKIGHPKAGASTAWVPSPTAATLHAMHYHQVSVPSIQQELLTTLRSDVDTILQIPLMEAGRKLSDAEITNELENNAQGILGYVVRWIDQGVGCSKVPDINDIGLMEDRATCRISSQHMANWLYHGVCTEQQVVDVMKKMAAVVDDQNASDPLYEKMAGNFEQSIAFNAALDLVLKGHEQPSGYTEPLLHAYRLKKKAQ
jgi:malate synthase